MKDNALDVSSGSPPGMLPDEVRSWRATAAVLRSTVLLLRSPVYAIFSVVDDLVSTIFPADCRACGSPMQRADFSPFDIPVCSLCLEHLRDQSHAIPSLLCATCGEALGMESDRFARPSSVEGPHCSPCRMAPPAFERAVAYGVYETELREMLHLLKYDGVQSLAGPLAVKLARAVLHLERYASWTGDAVVIAVPLFAASRRRRGFNQAESLADSALGTLRKLRPSWKLVSRHGLLKRVKETKSQFELSDKGRRRNLIGAFQVQDAANHLLGRDVLLIDDIYTTGATSRACAQVLRRAGARHVWVATLARAQKEQVALWQPGARDFG